MIEFIKNVLVGALVLMAIVGIFVILVGIGLYLGGALLCGIILLCLCFLIGEAAR